MKSVIREDEVVSMHTMANAILGITSELTKLNLIKRNLEGSFNSIGLKFMYNQSDGYDSSMDMTIDLQLGNDDPLFAEWLEFEKKAIAAIDKRVEEKRSHLAEIRDSFKRMS